MKEMFQLLIFGYAIVLGYSFYLYVNDPYEFQQLMERDLF